MSRAQFLAAAVVDIRVAFEWYEGQRLGLGHEFLLAVRAAIDSIEVFPDSCAIVHRDTRRFLVERFPYVPFYRTETSSILVVACLHAARAPDAHERRLNG